MERPYTSLEIWHKYLTPTELQTYHFHLEFEFFLLSIVVQFVTKNSIVRNLQHHIEISQDFQCQRKVVQSWFELNIISANAACIVLNLGWERLFHAKFSVKIISQHHKQHEHWVVMMVTDSDSDCNLRLQSIFGLSSEYIFSKLWFAGWFMIYPS